MATPFLKQFMGMLNYPIPVKVADNPNEPFIEGVVVRCPGCGVVTVPQDDVKFNVESEYVAQYDQIRFVFVMAMCCPECKTGFTWNYELSIAT